MTRSQTRGQARCSLSVRASREVLSRELLHVFLTGCSCLAGTAAKEIALGATKNEDVQLTQLKLEMTQLKSKLEAQDVALNIYRQKDGALKKNMNKNVKHLNAAHKEVRRLKSVLEKRHLEDETATGQESGSHKNTTTARKLLALEEASSVLPKAFGDQKGVKGPLHDQASTAPSICLSERLPPPSSNAAAGPHCIPS
jgi:hypothetical protein